ncbi:hypothetical protein Rhopal_007737-T1 [Rhodotorula paludigena]|uniref:NADH:ubiquinone oxidoreductase intermediate-associated protein 30 domain-containing protein n=1 Tax=Rhodotorula paludigena TaxID=86838 RepID=A0AAV5GZL6_9BASI|nr:hypothetical protein Rhopal_007737-T1 [Rhodotorula paludigena]
MSTTLFGAGKLWPAFTAVDDRIRGGKSTSHWTVDPDSNVGTFSGDLDITALGGAGFASQSTIFSPSRLSLSPSSTAGLLLTFVPSSPSPSASSAKPNPPSRFVLLLKNDEPARRPDGRRESVIVYEYAFDAHEYAAELYSCSEDEKEGVDEEKEVGRRSVTVLARWSDFKPHYRGKPAPDAKPLDPSSIYELSFMARSNFGEQAGPFSLDVVSISVLNKSQSKGWFRTACEAVRSAWARCLALVCGWWAGRGGADGAVRLP